MANICHRQLCSFVLTLRTHTSREGEPVFSQTTLFFIVILPIYSLPAPYLPELQSHWFLVSISGNRNVCRNYWLHAIPVILNFEQLPLLLPKYTKIHCILGILAFPKRSHLRSKICSGPIKIGV